jgi:hypothetical protein
MIFSFKDTLYSYIVKFWPSMMYKFQLIKFHLQHGNYWYIPDLNEPKTFNEKLLSLKLNVDYSKYSHLVDKYLVRNWVESLIGEQFLIPCYGVFDNPDKIDFSKFPSEYILKPTHGSGWVIISKKNNPNDWETYRIKMKEWLEIDYFITSGESQYKNIIPRIVCEYLLKPSNGVLLDFKFFCFGGKPTYVQVDIDRHTNHTRNFYDTNWIKQDFSICYPMTDKVVPKPVQLEEMLELAARLSQGFEFVRVDFYNVDGKIYFGELTFHPGSGYEPFSSYDADLRMGNLIKKLN